MREYTVIIEKDEDGFYVGEVVEIPGCYSQGETIEELMENIKEAIQASLEDMNDNPTVTFVDIRKVTV